MQLGRLTLLFVLAFAVLGSAYSCDIIQSKTSERLTYCDNHDGTITVSDRWINCQTPEGIWYHCFITINSTEIDTGQYNNTFGNDSEGQETNFTTPDGWYSLVLKKVGNIEIKNAITTVEVINNSQLSFGFGEDSRFYYTPSITRLKEEFMLGSADVKTNKDLDIEWRMKGKSPDLNIYINGEIWDGSKDVSADTISFKKGNTIVMNFQRPFVMDSNGSFMWLNYSAKFLNNQKFISLTVPKAWLQSAVFPIYIDPTTNTTQSQGFIYDTLVDSVNANTNYGSATAVQIGFSPAYQLLRIYTLIDYNSMIGVAGGIGSINNATYYLYRTGSVGNVDRYETMWICNKSFGEGSITWNTQEVEVPKSLCVLKFNTTPHANPTYPAWSSYNLTQEAKNVLQNNNSFTIYTNLSSEAGFAGLQITTYSSAQDTNVSRRPYFEINYNAVGGLLINAVKDEETLQSLTFNLTLSNSTHTTSFNAITSLNKDYTAIPNGDVTLTITNQSGGYEQRNYYIVVNSTNFINMTAYLLKNTDGLIRSFFVKDQSQNAISNALVTIDRQIGGVWTRVAEKLTDDSGVSAFLMNPSTLYRISATWQIFTSGYKYITPSESEYTILLGTTTASTFQNIFNTVAYSITPLQLSLPQSNATQINFTVLCTSNDLSNWGMTLTDENYTVLFSQNSTLTGGGMINATIDTTNLSRVYGTFMINRTGFNAYTDTKNWLVSTYGFGNNSLFAFLLNFKNDSSISDNTKSIISLFVIVGIMAGLIGIIGALGSGIVGMAVLTILTAFGWFNIPALVFMWLAVGGYVFLSRGGLG